MERQIRRLKASEYAEVRSLGDEIAEACAAEPHCQWYQSEPAGPVAPTLARHVDVDCHLAESRRDLREWAEQNLTPASKAAVETVDLMRPANTSADIVATLLYSVTDRPYRELYETTSQWSAAQRDEVIDVALRSRTRRDELLRAFRGGPYVYDIVMDVGAYRDLHRHRRCQQFRQSYGASLGFDTPTAIVESGIQDEYETLANRALNTVSRFPAPAAEYMLPFATRARFLFKMDFAEAEYICRLRSGVKGHFSYRQIAWLMKEKMQQVEPEMGRLMEATPPWVEDPLKR